jgi:hypothetical protein
MSKRSEQANRPTIDPGAVLLANGEIMQTLDRRLFEKGAGAWLSRHEIMGIISEEYLELQLANHLKNTTEMKNELIDIAVGCIFAVACINKNSLHW